MPEYPITRTNTQLITGRQFSAAICGYEERICFFSLSGDEDKHSSISKLNIEEQNCDLSQNCLAVDCPLNKTSRERLISMLGMQEDETVYGETALIWGTASMVDGLLKVIKQVESDILGDKKKTKTE